MKFRNGFVSNSSSTSFVCDMCNTLFNDIDSSLMSYGLIECEQCGAILCKACVGEDTFKIPLEVKINLLKKELEGLLKYNEQYDHIKSRIRNIKGILEDNNPKEIDEEFNHLDQDIYKLNGCPICKGEFIPDWQLKKWMLMKNSQSEKDLAKQVLSKFNNNYFKFREYLKGKFDLKHKKQ